MQSLFYISSDYLTFFQGISFVILAAACFPLLRQGRRDMPWGLIAIFALFYSLGCLLALAGPLFDSPLIIKIVQSSLALAGFLCLGEFAHRTIKLPSGRKPGRWLVLLPLTAVTMSAAYNGPAVLEVAIDSFPGAIVSVGAAIAFWQAGGKVKKTERFWLIAAGILFLVQGLLFAARFLPGLTGRAPLPIFPLLAPIPQINFTLVYLFLSGLTAMWIAFSFSQLTFARVELSQLSVYLSRKSSSYFYTSVLIVIFIIAGGWWLTNYTGRYFLQEKIESTRLDTDLMSDHLGGVLDGVNQGAMLLSNMTSIKKAITEQDKNALKQAAEDLLHAKSSYRLEKCLLLDSEGAVIASSELRLDRGISKLDPTIPVLAYALSGSRGYRITFDQTRESPSYWTAFPVRCQNGDIKGALLMVKNIESAEYFLKKHPYTFHLSPEGIILLASQPKLRWMTLWPLDAEVRMAITNNREYEFTPGKALLSARPQGNIVIFNGSPHLLVRSFHQWPIYIMTPIDSVVQARLATILLLLLLVVVTLVFFIDSQRLLTTSAQLLGAEKRFQLIFQNVPVAIFILDGNDGKILSENSFVYQWLGYSPPELRQMTRADIVIGPSQAQNQRSYRKKDGAIVEVEEVAAAIALDDESRQLLIAHDITERNQAAKELRLAREFSESVLKTAAALIVVLDRDGRIVLFNDHAEQTTGWKREEVLGKNWFERFILGDNLPGVEETFQTLLGEGQPLSYENPIITRTGETRIIAWNNTTLKDTDGQSYLVIATGIDVTEQRKYEETLKHLSLVDGLTGVANRRNFDEFFNRQWKLATREGTPLSLIMGDIDFFKRYNDALGHQAGDSCLIQVAAAMQDATRRPLDLVARYGGEEFIAAMPDTDQEGALKVAAEIRRRIQLLALPHPDSDVGAAVTMSLGVASVTPQTGMEPEALIAAADQALYRAKAGGRDRIEYLSPSQLNQEKPKTT